MIRGPDQPGPSWVDKAVATENTFPKSYLEAWNLPGAGLRPETEMQLGKLEAVRQSFHFFAFSQASPPFLFRQAKPLLPSARLPLFDLGSFASFRLHERRLSLCKWR